MILQCQTVSDVGCVRNNNEDIVLLVGGFYRDAADNFTVEIKPNSRFTAIVADGMGGYEGGEVASEMAVQAFDEFIMGLPGCLTADGIILRVKQWTEQIHAQIVNRSLAEPQCTGMGTTLVGIFCYENKIFRVNIGDSRLYRFRNETLKQLSVDHSMRELTGDMNQPSNLIYNSLGAGDHAFADVEEMTGQMLSDDRFLICSDGLSDMLTDEEIYDLLLQGADAQTLVDAAKAAGGRDNVSVVLLTVEDDTTEEETVAEPEETPEPTNEDVPNENVQANNNIQMRTFVMPPIEEE